MSILACILLILIFIIRILLCHNYIGIHTYINIPDSDFLTKFFA